MPYALKTATATLSLVEGEKTLDISSQTDTVRFTPTSSTEIWSAIDGYSIGDTSPETWQVTLGFVQDLDPASLMRFLQEHTGEKAILHAILKRGAQPVDITVTLSSSEFGGTADGSIATSSLTLQADGKPVWGEAV